MYRKTIGILLIIGSFLVLVVDRLRDTVSTILENIIFGNSKMQVVNGIGGDHSYGLHIDMHLERSLVVILILGILLYISSRKETE
ncbi:hypothetical protein ACLHDG_12085 [Sulfurovum sp. CS9]|uniref:hypothetical protein n=1 Tax=Sulfurovum sp. CS9 TaxID=3391146 RepID=UPI0039EA324E